MYLTASSVLFWLVLLIALGIIFIGARFIVAPQAGAKGFGVPAADAEKVAYLWAKGTRDVVSGLLLIVLLWLKVNPIVIGAFMLTAALIPMGDLINVYVHAGKGKGPALMIHGGTALFMWVLAFLLLLR